MGQGTWGLDDCGDGGYEAYNEMSRQKFFEELEAKKAVKRRKRKQKDAIKAEIKRELLF